MQMLSRNNKMDLSNFINRYNKAKPMARIKDRSLTHYSLQYGGSVFSQEWGGSGNSRDNH